MSQDIMKIEDEDPIQEEEDIIRYNKTVQVQPLPWVLNAASVMLEPYTSSDWELLDIYSQDLENGILLQQISIVYPNQRLILSLNHGRDRVQVRVLSQGFTSFLEQDLLLLQQHEQQLQQQHDIETIQSRNNNHHTPHQHLPLQEMLQDPHVPPCLRLVANTEIIIQPKPRSVVETVTSIDEKNDLHHIQHPKQPAHTCVKLRIQPHVQHFNEPLLQLHRSLLLSPLPPTSIVSSSSTSRSCSGSSIDKGNGSTDHYLVRRDLPNPPQGTAWVHSSFILQHTSSSNDPTIMIVGIWKDDIDSLSSSEDMLLSLDEEDKDILSSITRSKYPCLQNIAVIYLQPSSCVAESHIGTLPFRYRTSLLKQYHVRSWAKLKDGNSC